MPKTTRSHLKSRFWADLCTQDFARLAQSGDVAQVVAVLPVAAIEQHGPHLPLSVDTALADGMVAACMAHLPAHLPVLFLPTQAVGLSPEHAAFAGTLTLKSATLIQLWTDIAESVAQAGVKKLVLFNTHGGNVSAMDIVARDLRARLGMLVYSVSWFNLPLLDKAGKDQSTLFDAGEHRFGIHGGEIETSLMLALHPQRVDMEQAQNFASTAQTRAQKYAILGNGKSAKLGWQMQDYNVAGAVGKAQAATAKKGQALLDAVGRSLGQLLTEFGELPLSTVVEPTVR